MGGAADGWSWSMLSLCLGVPAHSVSPFPQLFMIPEVREGVVQFDQCAELFEDPEDDDEKPLLPAGPSNRKDDTGEVRGQRPTNHPSTTTPTPPHSICCHSFSPHLLVIHMVYFPAPPHPHPRARPSPPPLLRTRLIARTATDGS